MEHDPSVWTEIGCIVGTAIAATIVRFFEKKKIKRQERRRRNGQL